MRKLRLSLWSNSWQYCVLEHDTWWILDTWANTRPPTLFLIRLKSTSNEIGRSVGTLFTWFFKPIKWTSMKSSNFFLPVTLIVRKIVRRSTMKKTWICQKIHPSTTRINVVFQRWSIDRREIIYRLSITNTILVYQTDKL